MIADKTSAGSDMGQRACRFDVEMDGSISGERLLLTKVKIT